jgi:Zn finger protein HypA/HybF involved in hydrogenase expression
VIRRRRLQFFFRINPGLPPTFVDRFATTGRRSFEAAFAPRARRYRRSTRIVIVLLIGFGLGSLAAINLPVPENARLWIVLPSAALLPLAVLIHLVNLRLRCPSCRRSLTPAKGRYCPQCGGEGYQAGSGRCEDCGGRIEEETAEDSRSYRVRGCTHCGVFLDARGL